MPFTPAQPAPPRPAPPHPPRLPRPAPPRPTLTSAVAVTPSGSVLPLPAAMSRRIFIASFCRFCTSSQRGDSGMKLRGRQSDQLFRSTDQGRHDTFHREARGSEVEQKCGQLVTFERRCLIFKFETPDHVSCLRQQIWVCGARLRRFSKHTRSFSQRAPIARLLTHVPFGDLPLALRESLETWFGIYVTDLALGAPHV